MPVNANPAIQNVPSIAWDGTTSYPGNVQHFTRFGWSFEVTADLAADAVFNIEAAPVSDADSCLPGTFEPVGEVAACEGGAEADQATITIPAGTLAGAICSGTIPCKPNAYVRLTAVSGADDVRAVLVRQGPKMGG